MQPGACCFLLNIGCMQSTAVWHIYMSKLKERFAMRRSQQGLRVLQTWTTAVACQKEVDGIPAIHIAKKLRLLTSHTFEHMSCGAIACGMVC